jgi:peptidoglycan/LPS O-acetylase OafA/YrhL
MVEEAKKKERLYSLDGLRGIACCIIAFLWHYLNMQPYDQGMPLQSVLDFFYKYGQYFVELFFVLSGFVMAYTYREKIEKGLGLVEYMLKRYKHIWPLMMVTLVATTFLQFSYYAMRGGYYVYNCDIFHFVLNILCLQSGWFDSGDQTFNGPAWCISVEIFCYLIFYLVVYASKVNKNKYYALSLALILFSYYILNREFYYPVVNAFMARGIGSFFIGVLLKELYEKLDENYYKKIYGVAAVCAVIVLFAALLNQVHMSMGAGMQTIFMMFLSIAFVWIALTLKPFKIFLSTKPLIWLGKISMDVYLWHIPVQLIIKNIDSCFGLNLNYGSKLVWIIYIALVLAIATVSNKALSKGIEDRKGLAFTSVAFSLLVILSIIIRVIGPILIRPIDNNLSWNEHSQIVYPDNSSTEFFTVNEDLSDVELSFYTVTWNNQYPEGSVLIYSLIDEQNNIVTQGNYDLRAAQDGRIGKINVDDILTKGTYRIIFNVQGNDSDDQFALLSNNDGTVAVKLSGKRG